MLSTFSQFLEHFYLAKLKLHTHTTFLHPLPWALSTTLYFLYLNLIALGTTCKWNHTDFFLMYLAYSS